jgi:RNA polymerase sigma factor (sigma-70 family)
MTNPQPPRDSAPRSVPPPEPPLTEQPTVELVIKAQAGDRLAVQALLQRCLPRLKRWARGKLPAVARGQMDTDDLVQDAAFHIVKRLDKFEPRHVGAMQAYLRQSVINKIRDEIRRVGRHQAELELPEDHPSDATSPLEAALQGETYQRYRNALAQVGSKDRELIVARIESQWSFAEIAERFEMPSAEAARMAVTRAVKRLTESISPPPRA